MDIKFNEGFVYSEGERVKILTVLKYLEVNTEESRGENFKGWIIKNKIIKGDFEVEKEERAYYLKNYKERKRLNFSNETKNYTKRSNPGSPNGSVRSVLTGTTIMNDEAIMKINEIYESLKEEKDKKEEIKKIYKEFEEKNKKYKKENKELLKRIEELEKKNEKYKRNNKKYMSNPELYFEKIKEKYKEVNDIVIYTKPKKNKVRKHIANGKIY